MKEKLKNRKQKIIESLQETERFVKQFMKDLRGGDVVGLIGPLGAGKTTVVQMIAKSFGIKQRPRSPSYTLLQPYPLPKPINGIATLVHVDAYRVGGVDLLGAGLADYLHDSTALVLIEWADRLPPNVHLTYTIAIHPGRRPAEREITIAKTDVR